jgi:Bromodomain
VALGIPNYPDIIKEPMDLSTIQKRLNSHYYANHEGFAHDVRLTFNNALCFNSVRVSCMIVLPSLW